MAERLTDADLALIVSGNGLLPDESASMAAELLEWRRIANEVASALLAARNFIAKLRTPQDTLQACFQIRDGGEALDLIDTAIAAARRLLGDGLESKEKRDEFPKHD